jgi:hypothetical protein
MGGGSVAVPSIHYLGCIYVQKRLHKWILTYNFTNNILPIAKIQQYITST